MTEKLGKPGPVQAAGTARIIVWDIGISSPLPLWPPLGGNSETLTEELSEVALPSTFYHLMDTC